jgi:hypothetical protein
MERMARPKTSADGISKMEAVRQAIASLGNDVKPPEILKFVKDNYNVKMSYDMASNYKGTALKQLGIKRKRRKSGRKAATTSAPAANGHTGGSISLEDIQAVKALADRLGAEKVWQLAKVLAK